AGPVKRVSLFRATPGPLSGSRPGDVRTFKNTGSGSPRMSGEPVAGTGWPASGGSCGRRIRQGSAWRTARLPSVADVVLFHLAVQGGPIQAENLGRLLLVPVRALQRLHDRHLLDLGQSPVRRDDEIR